MYAKYLICSAVARRRKVGGGTNFFPEIAKKRPQRRKSERYGRYGIVSKCEGGGGLIKLLHVMLISTLIVLKGGLPLEFFLHIYKIGQF